MILTCPPISIYKFAKPIKIWSAIIIEGGAKKDWYRGDNFNLLSKILGIE